MSTPTPPTDPAPAVPPTLEEAAQQHADANRETYNDATISALIIETAKLKLKIDWSDLPAH